MFCRKCGAQNDESANFCGNCGAKLTKITYTGQQEKLNNIQYTANQEKNINKKKSVKKIAVILTFFVLLSAFLIAGFFVLRTKRTKKQYADAMDNGYKYLEKMDYKKAEAEFLKALAIAPKEAVPYSALADTYLAQDELKQAVEIIEQAAENIPEEKLAAESETAAQKSIGQKFEEIKKLEKYVWTVDPAIEADAIYFLPVDNTNVDCVNDTHRQFATDYAVIRKGDAYSLIGTNGELADDMLYESIQRFAGTYILNRAEGKYEPQFGYIWTTYSFENGEIVPISGLGSGGPQNEYYYHDSLHNLLRIYVDPSYSTYKEVPETPIPVQRTEKIYTKGESDGYTFGTDGLPYAVYADGALVTDFEYDEMGAWSEGLIAVKKNGKWGYLNEQGETIIPIEYSASWYYPEWDNTETETVYAASGGYVPLCKDGVWELRNTEGRLIIMPGVFEQICPVYEGKCWVKRNGKWGMIQIGKGSGPKDIEKVSEPKDIDYEALYAPVIQNILTEYGDYNIYYKYDIDKDGVDELMVQEGTCEADYRYQVYTIQDGKLFYIDQIPGGHTGFCEEESGREPYVYSIQAHMGYETVSTLRMEDGKIVTEELHSREVAPGDEYFEAGPVLPNARVNDLSLLK